MEISFSAKERKNGTVTCRGEKFHLLFDEQRIARRVREMGQAISRDYEGRKPILIGVLNGSFIFLGDLMRAIDIECEVDFMKLSSYGAKKVSSGDVRELKHIDADIKRRDIIVVEDIVDTGVSMHYILDQLESYHPSSLAVATFLHKPEATQREVKLNYIGFEIPNLFVIGYGLDYGQLGRNLSAIYIQATTSEGQDPEKPSSLFN